MATLNKNEMKAQAKASVFEGIAIPEGAIRIGEFEYAIPAKVDGQEIWVVVSAVAKNWYDTKQADAFNIQYAVDEYAFTCKERADRRAAAEAKKAEKAKSKGKKAEA